MTIHSLAVKIIKEKPEVVMLSDEFNIADDLQKNIQGLTFYILLIYFL